MYFIFVIISGTITFLIFIYSCKWVLRDRIGFEPKLSLIGSLIAFIVFLNDFQDQKLHSEFLELSKIQNSNIKILSEESGKVLKEGVFETYSDKLKALYSSLIIAKKNTEITIMYFNKSPDLINDIIYEKDNLYPMNYFNILNDPVFYGYLDDCSIENLLEIESYMFDFFQLINNDHSDGAVPCSESKRCEKIYRFMLSEHLRYVDLNMCLINTFTKEFSYEDLCIAQEECEAQSRQNSPRESIDFN